MYENSRINARIKKLSPEEEKKLFSESLKMLAKFEAEDTKPLNKKQREWVVKVLSYYKNVYKMADKIRAKKLNSEKNGKPKRSKRNSSKRGIS